MKSAVVSRDESLIRCSRSIELNPVRAGMVQHPGEYRWRSYRWRALGSSDPLLDEDPWYAGLGSTPEARQLAYQAWLASSIRGGEWEHIRQATQRTRAIGTENFQRQIEAMTGGRLVGEARGRPRRERVGGPGKPL